MVKKIEDMFVSTVHERARTERRTDGRTDIARRHRQRFCKTSRGKNIYVSLHRVCVLSTAQPSGVINRVPLNRGKFVTFVYSTRVRRILPFIIMVLLPLEAMR